MVDVQVHWNWTELNSIELYICFAPWKEMYDFVPFNQCNLNIKIMKELSLIISNLFISMTTGKNIVSSLLDSKANTKYEIVKSELWGRSKLDKDEWF